MNVTSGFYKNENGELSYAPNTVLSVDYLLERDKKDTYKYPIDGWYWFDSIEVAHVYYGIQMSEIKTDY